MSDGASIDAIVRPDLRRHQVAVALSGVVDLPIELRIGESGHEMLRPPGEARLDVGELATWTPETPVLSGLRVTVGGGSGGVERIPFGFREVSIQEDRFFLNLRPLYIKGADIDASETRETVAWLKSAGFNALRINTFPSGPLLTAADETGMLVFALADGGSSVFSAQSGAELARTLNHPSLAAWTVSTLGTAERARAIDPSRPIIVNDGSGQCLRPYRKDTAGFEELSVPVIASADPVLFRLAQNIGAEGAMTFLRIGQQGPAQGTVRQDVFDAWLAGATALIQRARLNASLSGYFLSLGSLIGAAEGRNERAAELLAKANGDLVPVIRIRRINLGVREETPVEVALINAARFEGRAELVLHVVGPTNQTLWKKKRAVKIGRKSGPIWTGDVAASGAPGVHHFGASITTDRTAESERAFYVITRTPGAPIEAHVLDPNSVWAPAWSKLVRERPIIAPIHVIPPLANTIRAYPDDAMGQVLGQVWDGAAAIFYEPPPDWNLVGEQLDPPVTATPVSMVSGPTASFATIHPVFDGLTSGELMNDAYRLVQPSVYFQETGEEDICRAVGLDGERVGSGVLVQHYGSGHLVFTGMRVMENLGHDSVADIVFRNFLLHFSRRAVPGEGMIPVPKKIVEWLRRERTERIRRWKVIGAFAGADAAYPPESELRFDATYPGWYNAVSWRDWYAVEDEGYALDLGAAVAPRALQGRIAPLGTAYAYAEIHAEARGTYRLDLDASGTWRAWLNGAEYNRAQPEVFLRQGRNTLLVKVAQHGRASIVRATMDRDRLAWWR